jgi:hypothetical protein
MTLATIAEAVFDEVQINRETAIVGNTRPSARRLLRYANRVGLQLSREWNWQALRREQTFTATAGELQSTALPSDFLRFVPGTFYDRTNDSLIVGPISPMEWQALVTTGFSGVERRFIYRNGEIRVLPVFTGGEACAFEYITNAWCQNASGTGQTLFNADDDTALIDEELMTLAIASDWLQSEGLPAGHVESAFESRLKSLGRQDQATRRGLSAGDIFAPMGVSRHFNGQPPAFGAGGNLSWLW